MKVVGERRNEGRKKKGKKEEQKEREHGKTVMSFGYRREKKQEKL